MELRRLDRDSRGSPRVVPKQKHAQPLEVAARRRHVSTRNGGVRTKFLNPRTFLLV